MARLAIAGLCSFFLTKINPQAYKASKWYRYHLIGR